MAQAGHSQGMGRRSSTLAGTISLKSMQRRSSLSALDSNTSVMSDLSFKRWHKRMQARHKSLGTEGFRLWTWCYKGCAPCRWFDSIDYEAKPCKYCIGFKRFKMIGTFCLMAIFIYTLLYVIWGDELLPGGTIFFMFLLFVVAYLVGYILLLVGLPPMIGHMLVGIVCGNMPPNWLPPHDKHYLERISFVVEKVSLILAIIRAGLLLDMSRIKGHVLFIIKISVLPLLCEQTLTVITSHYLLHLPWEWSALQGSLISIVSLATITSVMEKNRIHGYGEDKHLSTVLIAASSCDVIIGIFCYIICLSFVFPSDHNGIYTVWEVTLNVVKQLLIGLATGIICGILIAFFPDKHNVDAATERILVLGLGAYAIAAVCSRFDMVAGGTLAVMITCLIASNMWEELGWHDRNNPVQYFYTMVYYYVQPVVLSLIGFSMNFHTTGFDIFIMGISVLTIGLVGREITCYVATFGKTYPTTPKEKVFICIAWFSKGTFQALLAFAIENMIHHYKSHLSESTIQSYMRYSEIIKETTVLAILLTTPLACYGMAILTPVLLNQVQVERHQPQNV